MDKKVKMFKLFTCITIIVMFICIIILSFQLVKIANLKSQEKELMIRKEQLIEEIYNYNTTNGYYSNNRAEYLDEYAREILNWSDGNEIWYTNK